MGAEKHLEHFRTTHLKPGEKIAASAEGYIGEMMGSGKNAQHNGVLIITDTRAAFCRKGIFGEVFESIPLKNITSIERKTTLSLHTLRLHTSHDDLSFKSFKKEDTDAAADAVEAGRAAAEPSNPSASPAVAGPLEALKKLGELRDAGVVSPDEFEAKKAELLERI